MPKTTSEQLFEQFCAEHGLRCESVPPSAGHTPDYHVYFGPYQVVVEVKQIDPSPGDAVQLARLEAGGIAEYGGEAGKRVRQEIIDSRKQIQSAKGKYPALLVLYNNSEPICYLDPMFILVGMYGQLKATIEVPTADGEPFLTGLRFGGKRRVTKEHNTTLSAVCVLINNPDGQPTLTFYHNHFAAQPFESDWFRGDRVKHYVRPKAESGEFRFWAPI